MLDSAEVRNLVGDVVEASSEAAYTYCTYFTSVQ